MTHEDLLEDRCAVLEDLLLSMRALAMRLMTPGALSEEEQEEADKLINQTEPAALQL